MQQEYKEHHQRNPLKKKSQKIDHKTKFHHVSSNYVDLQNTCDNG